MLVFILTIYRKCLPSQFVNRCIYMHIPIVIGGQNGWNISCKEFLRWRSVVWQLLVLFLTIYRDCFYSQPLSRTIRMHIHILIGIRNRHINSWKKDHIFTQKCSFLSLTFKMKVSCMPIASLIFSLFNVNALFFSSEVVAYFNIFPS